MTCPIRPDVVLVIDQPSQAMSATAPTQRQGCVFANAFTPSASPGDALWSLLTGCHAHRQLEPAGANGTDRVAAESIARHLAVAGYWTVWLGPWLPLASSSRLGFDHVASTSPDAVGRDPDAVDRDMEYVLTELRRVAHRHDRLFLTIATGRAAGPQLDDIRRLFADALIVQTSTTGHAVAEDTCPELNDRTLRVSLSLDWPGELADKMRGELVTTLDIAPTLYDLCGATTPRHHDGRSLRPLLYRRQSCLSGWRTYVVSEFHAAGRMTAPARTLRSERWRYTRLPHHGEAVFDLEHDPHAQVNLADVVAHRAARDELSNELDAWQTRYDDRLDRLLVTGADGNELAGEEFSADLQTNQLLAPNDRERIYRAVCPEIDVVVPESLGPGAAVS